MLLHECIFCIPSFVLACDMRGKHPYMNTWKKKSPWNEQATHEVDEISLIRLEIGEESSFLEVGEVRLEASGLPIPDEKLLL
jgi:hypothetical protein